MHHGFNGQDSSWTGVPGLRLNLTRFCSTVVSFQQHDCKRSAYRGCERRFCLEKWTLDQKRRWNFIQKLSEAVSKHWQLGFCPESTRGASMTTTEERGAAVARQNLCSDSAELSLLQELKAKVAGFSLSSDIKYISFELTLFVFFRFCSTQDGPSAGHSFNPAFHSVLRASLWKPCYPSWLPWLSIK